MSFAGGGDRVNARPERRGAGARNALVTENRGERLLDGCRGRRVEVWLCSDFAVADFQLDFELNVSVTAPSANVRVLTAGSNAIAHLYQISGNKKVSVGRFYMPFSLIVTKD